MKNMTENTTWKNLASLDQQLAQTTDQHTQNTRQTYQAKTEYKLAMSKARQNSTAKTAQQREDQALLECEPQYRNYMETQGQQESILQQVRTLTTRCENGRSLNTSLRGKQTNEEW
jgi:hypothetical protein